MISTSALSFAYPGQVTCTYPDFVCRTGEHLLILGPSGSGKTTLLHLLGGLLAPQSGEIHIADTPVHLLSGHALDTFRGRHIGIVFQKPHFIRSLNALENLLLVQSLAGQTPDAKRAYALLAQLGIGARSESKTFNMSVGEQQRLAIARALINRPAVILADEPSSALDDDHCKQMIQLLLSVADEAGSNLIVVTHDSRIRERMGQKIILLTPSLPAGQLKP